MIYDLAILGGGPAGVAAGVYAARKRLKTVFITKDFESQSVVSPDIQNWIGTPNISGNDLAKSFKKHLLAYADDVLELKENELVQKIEKTGNNFKITSTKNTYEAKAVLVATGSRRRKLQVPGADKFENKGITYCASCDGPLFAGADVAVIGGGNAALETVLESRYLVPSARIARGIDGVYDGERRQASRDGRAAGKGSRHGQY